MAVLHRIITAPRSERGVTDFGGGLDRLADDPPAGAASPSSSPTSWPIPRRGSNRSDESPPVTTRSPSRCSIPASSSSPTSACCRSSTRSPALSATSRPASAKLRARYAAAAARAAPDDRRDDSPQRDPITCNFARTATGCSTSSASCRPDASASRAATDRRLADEPRGRFAVDFRAPTRLWLLVLVAALAVGYVFLQTRHKTYAVKFTNLALLDSVAPKRPGWRRHLPAAIVVLCLASLVVGFAKPARTEKVPRERATIIMAIDTSLSMKADDVSPEPSRGGEEGGAHVRQHPAARLNVGLVTFNGTAQVRIPPTLDRGPIQDAIRSIQLGERTAIGEAIYASLDAIKAAPPGPKGEQVPARIVLMSDGETTTGRPDAQAAAEAKKQKVPVSTIAFGTDHGEITVPGEPLPVQVRVNPDALARIAQATGGSAFTAVSAGELKKVYKDIGSSVGYVKVFRDITTWFVGIALAAAVPQQRVVARLVQPPALVRSRISAEARSPERTAPSIAPCDVVDVSVPAQCTRPNGSRSSGPKRVRMPGGRCAIEQPRVHSSFHHGVSMISAGTRLAVPNRAVSASSTASPPLAAVERVDAVGHRSERERPDARRGVPTRGSRRASPPQPTRLRRSGR